MLYSNVIVAWMEATQTFEIFGFLILLVTAAIFTAKLCRFENKTDKYTWIIIGLLFTSCKYFSMKITAEEEGCTIQLENNR